MLRTLSIAGGIAIVLGYAYMAAMIAPQFEWPIKRRVAAIAFFVLCADTHYMLVQFMLLKKPLTVEEMQSWHWVGHMVLQGLSVWLVAVGLKGSDKKKLLHRRLHPKLQLAAMAFVAMTLLTFVGTAFVKTNSQPNNLYGYSEQKILNLKPVFHRGDVLEVYGTKCTHDDVNVHGSLVWQSDIPPGAVVPGGSGARFRVRGCTSLHYRNPIPDAVFDATRQLGGRVTWRLVGVETGPGGEVEIWRTEHFVVEA